jgi:DMSO/TMAO reductase YedYZ molybdopterin-dependent catalytic subunit
MSLPLEKALHPDTLLVSGMNGDVLTPEHGYPVRLIVPGWYGMASVKWLTNIRLLDKPFRGFHESDYYVFVAEGETGDSLGERVTTMLVKSLITWKSSFAWRQWEFQWHVGKPGYYLIRARAIDAKGNSQPEHAPWNFRGYAVNSIHVVPVTVRR